MDSYNEINREMSLDDGAESTVTNETVKINKAEMDGLLATDEGNNNPEKPLVAQKLELDDSTTEKLSKKPLDKYRFVKSLGHGGMKMVLQVHDRDTTRDVAMAVLPDVMTRPKKDAIRFVREARITAALEHPNIVPVHDIGIDSTGAPYYTMKLVRGRSLAALLTKMSEGDEEMLSMYTLNRMMRVFMKICYGVSFAHSRGVIHLDLKPDNIQIGDFGEVLILDWGLAKVIDRSVFDKHMEQTSSGSVSPDRPEAENEPENEPDGDDTSTATMDGVMKGTPGYMAPEQAAGLNHKKDVRTDVYALGAILYSMMTLKYPLVELGVRERIQATVGGRIIPPRERTPEREIPAAVEAIIMKAMSLRPENRYQSVREIREEINAFLNGFAPRAEHASFLKKFILFARRNLILVVFSFIMLLGGAISLTYMSHYHSSKLEWTPLNTIFFEKKSLKNDMFRVLDGETGKVRPPRFSHDGIVLKTGEILDFGNLSNQDFRLDLRPKEGILPEKMDIILYADETDLLGAKGENLPHGYAFRHGHIKDYDTIASKVRGDIPRCVVLTKINNKIPVNVLSIVRTQSEITIRVNNSDQTEMVLTDYTMPNPPKYNRIAIRCTSGTLCLNSVLHYAETIPENPPITAKGDICQEAGQYRAAITEYLRAAELYPYQAVSDDALIRAYIIATFKLNDEALQKRIRGYISNRPAFSGGATVREIDILYAWHHGKYDDAMQLLHQTPGNVPDSGTLRKILALPARKLPAHIAKQFLDDLQKCRDLEIIDLTGYGIAIPKHPKKQFILNR